MGFSSSCHTAWCQHPCEHLLRGFSSSSQMHFPQTLSDAAKRAAQPLLSPAWSGVHQGVCSHSLSPVGTRWLLTRWAQGSVELLGSSQQFSSWGLLALICTLGEALLQERWGSLCEQCWLMYRHNVVHVPAYCSQPASPVPVTPVSCGFPQVTVPSGAGALLLVKPSSNTQAEVVGEYCF